MILKIEPNEDGFQVVWENDKGDVLNRVRGFATHDMARDFVSDFLIKLARAYSTRDKQ